MVVGVEFMDQLLPPLTKHSRLWEGHKRLLGPGPFPEVRLAAISAQRISSAIQITIIGALGTSGTLGFNYKVVP